MSSSSVETQQASAMKHSRDLDDVMCQTIDDSVVAVNDLADRRVAKLRNDTSRTRMVLEPLHGRAEPFGDKLGITSGVTGDMAAYRLDALVCLGCPEDRGH